MRSFCKGIAVLRTELASSIVGEQLRARTKDLQNEISLLLAAGVRSKLDGQASIIAQLLALPVASIQTSLSVLVTLLLEFGAAFGPFIVALALVTRSGPHLQVILPPRQGQALASKPTRLIREGGQLVIK